MSLLVSALIVVGISARNVMNDHPSGSELIVGLAVGIGVIGVALVYGVLSTRHRPNGDRDKGK